MALGNDAGLRREPAAAIFGRVARELETVAARVEALEHALGAAAIAGGGIGEAALRELQALDAIRQHVAGVAIFLAALTPTLRDAWVLDPREAAREVTLADMGARLAGERGTSFVSIEAYELFD